MNAREFQQSQFFNNVLVSTIKFLESMPAKTLNEKAQFLRGLPRILDQFPNSVLAKTIVPAILEELNDRDLMAPALRCLFKIMDILPYNKRVFQDLAIPRLREIFMGKAGKATSDHASIESGLIVILENVGAIAELCSGKDFQDGTRRLSVDLRQETDSIQLSFLLSNWALRHLRMLLWTRLWDVYLLRSIF